MQLCILVGVRKAALLLNFPAQKRREMHSETCEYCKGTFN